MEPRENLEPPPLSPEEAALAEARNRDATERRAHEAADLAEHVTAAAEDLARRREALTGEGADRSSQDDEGR